MSSVLPLLILVCVAIIRAEFEVSLASLLLKPSSQCEINAIDVDVPSHTLYIASGDSNAIAVNLDTLKIVNSYSGPPSPSSISYFSLFNPFLGHNDYLHCLKFLPRSNTLVTGSEDNTARLWGTSAFFPFFCNFSLSCNL